MNHVVTRANGPAEVGADSASLRGVAAAADRTLATAHPREVMQWAAETFGDRLAVASSMGDGVLAHLAASVAPGIEVFFLDTGYHFAETIGTRDAVAASYDVNVRTLLPILSVPQQDALHGERLFERDPDACCRMRKVEPLDAALEPYLAWVSGVRRDESPERVGTRVVAFDERRGKIAVHPLATWTQADIDAYAREHQVLVNPLVSEGYASIGCAPCTRAVDPGEGARAGRWAGLDKSECGLHR